MSGESATERRVVLVEIHETLAIQRILVIDDNQDAADTLVMLLNILGSAARAAYSAAAGLEVLTDFKPEAVFLDLGMPEMDGYEAARRIRALPGGDRVKLVALTGWGKQQVGERVEEAGFDHHLTKPASYEALCDLLWRSSQNPFNGLR